MEHAGDHERPLVRLKPVIEPHLRRVLRPKLLTSRLDRATRRLPGIARFGLRDLDLLPIVFDLLSRNEPRRAVHG